MSTDEQMKEIHEQLLLLGKFRLALDNYLDIKKKFCKFLMPIDKVELVTINQKYEEIYWKYFEKFIKKIRGL